MSDSSNSSSGGIGVFTVVGIVFIILKLVGVITWSWWLVTLPFTIPIAIIVAVLAVSGIAILISRAWE